VRHIAKDAEVWSLADSWHKIVRAYVHNGGSQFGSVLVPESAIFDHSLRFGDVGALAYMQSLRGAYPWSDFMAGVGGVHKMNSIRRLNEGGYISVQVATIDEGSVGDWVLNIWMAEHMPVPDDMTKKPNRMIPVRRPRLIGDKAGQPLPVRKIDKEKKAPYKPYRAIDYRPSTVGEEAWRAWCAYRSERGLSVRKTYVARLKEKFETDEVFRAEGDAILYQSIEQGWQGLFPVGKGHGSRARSQQILTSVEGQTYEDEL
jgi:hypothetical protein